LVLSFSLKKKELRLSVCPVQGLFKEFGDFFSCAYEGAGFVREDGVLLSFREKRKKNQERKAASVKLRLPGDF